LFYHLNINHPPMLSFINEIDDPIVQRDILDLNRRILLFREGKLNEESFRSLRLARGVYGQRQPGVQMIRIKVPMGLLTFDQFRAILNVCDEYSTGKYHITTRQDIQIHHVKLEDMLPEDVEENLDELLALRRELKGDFAQKQATLRALTRHFRDKAS